MLKRMIRTCPSNFVYGVYGGHVTPYTGSTPYKSTLPGSVYGVYGQNTYTYIQREKNSKISEACTRA